MTSDKFITSRKKIKALLKHASMRPKKAFGQNYLINASVAERIVKTAKIGSEDVVVEPGAGIGALSFHIAAKAKRVICVEIDPRAVEVLEELAEGLGYTNIEVVQKDVLEFDPQEFNLKPFNYKIAGSLPYDLAKPIIRKFLEESTKPETMGVLIQREVAKEYAARSPDSTFLAQYTKVYSEVKYIQTVTKQAFYPTPPVNGAILQFKLRKKPLAKNPAEFTKFLKTGFSAKRSTLLNTLSSQLKIKKPKMKKILEKADLKPKARAQELDMAKWVKIWTFLHRTASV